MSFFMKGIFFCVFFNILTVSIFEKKQKILTVTIDSVCFLSENRIDIYI